MRYFLSILFLMMSHVGYADEPISSYQESLDQFLEKSKTSESPFSEQDKAIMAKASASLVSSFPNPGLQVGEKAPDFILKNALGNDVSLIE